MATRQQHVLPALPIQEQLWLMQQMAPDVGVANISSVLEWHGPLDLFSLQAATADFVRRHPWLRTRVEPASNGRLLQTCEAPRAIPVTVVDLQHLEGDALEFERARTIRNAAEMPLESSLFPNVRMLVVRSSPRRHDLLVVFSHMTCDGLSTGIICKESLQAYEARLAGRQPSWIGEMSEQIVNELQQTTSRLANRPGEQRLRPSLHAESAIPLRLPCRAATSGPPQWRGKRVTFEVPDLLSDQLNAVSLQLGVSPFVTWMSILQVVLSRHSGQLSFSADIVRAGRTSEQRRCVGPFFEMVRRTLELDTSLPFAELLSQNRKLVDEMNSAGPHEYPLPATRSSFLVDYQAELPTVSLADGTHVIPRELDNGAAIAELCFGIRRSKRRFSGHVKFDVELYQEDFVRRLIGQVLACLETALADPALPIENLDIRTAEEIIVASELSRPVANADVRPDEGQTMLFDEQIINKLAHSERVSVRAAENKIEFWSGSRLVAEAHETACRLIRAGVQRHDRVGILMEKGPSCVAAILAIAQCGAAWVPVEPAWPMRRKQDVIKHARLRALLTTRTLFGEADGLHESLVVVDDEAMFVGGMDIANALPTSRSLDDTAYVCFTSGSTGVPKGVEVTHRNLLNFFHGINTLDSRSQSVCWLAVTSLSFDISILELIWPLTRGFEIVVADREQVLAGFAKIVRDHGITHFQCTPSMMQMLVGSPANLDALSLLERLYLGGEALPQSLADCVSERTREVFNMYGPTETTVWSTCWRVIPGSPVRIGRPLTGQGVLVLDRQQRSLPFNLAGELFICGDSVAKGYFDQPELTEERFVNHPGCGRMFRTGDLVQLFPEGNLHFVGRCDDQIKLHGHRIEPGEIDAECLAFPGVRQSATVLANSDAAPKLWTFVVADEVIDFHQLRHFLSMRLPAVMVPTHFRAVEEIPLSSSGKTDRRLLKEWANQSAEWNNAATDLMPSSRRQQSVPDDSATAWNQQRLNQLVELVQEELHLPSLPIDGVWSDLEIHSLDVAGLVVRAKKSMGLSIAVADLFGGASIRKTLLNALGMSAATDEAAPSGMRSLEPAEHESSKGVPEPESGEEKDLETRADNFDHLTRVLESEPDEVVGPHPYARYVEPVKSLLLARVGLDIAFVRGEGCYLDDADGNRYLDCIAQYGGLPFGSNPPQIWEALESVRSRQLPNVATQSMLGTAGELARRLLDLLPDSFQHIIFCNSGAEATEVAIKLCRSATGRRGIVSTKTGFHGLTSGALPVTGSRGFREGFFSDSPEFRHVPFGDSASLEAELRQHPDFFAAFLVEPVQGEAGILIPPAGYLERVRRICDAFGVLMVVDEVQTGLGRTGKMFGFEHESAIPDVVMIAKALGGGLIPCGAVACQPKAWSTRFGLRHSSTFAGNTMASACGIATVDLLQNGDCSLVRNVQLIGEHLLAGLQALRSQHPDLVAGVRGRGLMLAIDFEFNSLLRRDGLMPVLVQEQLLMHLIVSYLLHCCGIRVAPAFNGRTTLRIEPPLTFGKAESDRLLAGLADVLAVVERGDSGVLVSPMTGARGQEVSRIAKQAGHRFVPARSEAAFQATVPADGDFGFLVHLSDIDDLVRFDGSLGVFDRRQLAELKRRFTGSAEPVLVGEDLFRSATGRVARGKFVLVPFTPEELMAMPRAKALRLVESAAIRAAEEKVRLIGLGGFTSIISAGGMALDAGRLPPLTSGNAFTVSASLTAIDHACQRSGLSLTDAIVAVIGAAGQIGGAMAELLFGECARLILVGRPGDERRTRQQLDSIVLGMASVIAPPETVGENDNWKRNGTAKSARDLVDHWVGSGKIVFGSGLEDIANADIVVAATSAVAPFIDTRHLKRNAIVCDLSRPANVMPEVRSQRKDICLIEGGLIRPASSGTFQVFAGPRRDAIYACVAESALWVLEPELGLPSAVGRLDAGLIRRLGVAAARHGFEVLLNEEPAGFNEVHLSTHAGGS
jgi:amino acid adenylation domain-containing protein